MYEFWSDNVKLIYGKKLDFVTWRQLYVNIKTEDIQLDIVKDVKSKFDSFISNQTDHYPAGRYWSPGRLKDIPLQRPQDVP